MPIKRFAKLDEVPESLRADAIETKSGEFVVVEEDSSALRGALQKEREARKEAERTAKDATEQAADIQRQLDAAKVQVGNAGTTEELLASWRKERDAAVAAVQTELGAARGELKKLKLYDRAKAAFLANGGKKHLADAFVELEAKRLDLDGDTPIVLGKDGKPSPHSLDEFVTKEHRGAMPDFYEGTKAAGSESRGGAGGKPGTGDAKLADVVGKPGGGLRLIEAANAAQ